MIRRKLAREQLDNILRRYRILLMSPAPKAGWIRSIREALGMSGRQLARRTNLSQQRIAIIEKQELEGSLTLKTLRKMAEGLDCVLIFSLIPRTNLEQTLREQALRVVKSGSNTADPDSSEVECRRIREEAVSELLAHPPSTLWNER